MDHRHRRSYTTIIALRPPQPHPIAGCPPPHPLISAPASIFLSLNSPKPSFSLPPHYCTVRNQHFSDCLTVLEHLHLLFLIHQLFIPHFLLSDCSSMFCQTLDLSPLQVKSTPRFVRASFFSFPFLFIHFFFYLFLIFLVGLHH